mgnify:CR=1 FL=1
MAYEGLLRTFTFAAGDDMSTTAYQYKAVAFSGLSVVPCLTVTTRPLGILQNMCSAGGAAEVALIGSISKLKMTGSVTTANGLIGITSGYGVEVTSGTSGQHVLAAMLDNLSSAASGMATVLIVGPSYI